MRILRIGITNLNSLRGTQTIDFTADPLASNQLYAIVGPTGAGKTTILDAITLALYGQTERNKDEKDRKDGSGSIMSYGEGECRAELEYETAAGRFRNVWHRQRAHKKPEKDLTASRREINKWNPKTEVWDLLATKKKEVDEQTVKTVGLDYERFVRSVMLTQGDFARFLKSKAGDKAAILEKITGTEIYKDLSVAAFQRHKLAREAYEKSLEMLAGSPPLETEVRQKMESEMAAKKARSEEVKTTLTRLLAQLALLEKWKESEARWQQSQRENERLSARWAELQPDRERLLANDKLELLRTVLNTADRLRASHAQQTKELEAQAKTLEDVRTRQAQLAGATAEALSKRKDFDEKLPGREDKFRRAALLETAIAEVRRDQLAAETALAKVRAESHKLTEEINGLTATISGLETQLGGRRAEEVEKELQRLEAEVPQSQRALRDLNQAIEARRIRDRLAAEEQSLTLLNKQLEEANAASIKAEENRKKAESAVDGAIILLNGLRISAGLEEHKMNLRPGEACPVCGATEHPALLTHQPVTASRIKEAEGQLTQLRTQLTQATKSSEESQRNLIERNRTVDAVTIRQTSLREQLSAFAGVGEKPLSELLELRANKEHALKAEEQQLKDWQRLRTQLPRLSEAVAQRTAATQRLEVLAVEEKELVRAVEQGRAALIDKTLEKEKLIGKHTVEECRRLTQERDDKLRTTLAAAEAAERKQTEQLAAATERQRVMQERLTQKGQDLQQVETELSSQLATLNTDEATARGQLLPPEMATSLRKSILEQEKLRQTAQAMLQERQEHLSVALAAIKDLPSPETLQQSREETENAGREVNRDIGGLELQLRQDDERIRQNAARRAELEQQKKETDRWGRLNDLIGSADGKKFRSYAQSITLQQLIEVGNDHLTRINPRYRMAYEPPEAGGPEKLEMVIIDQYQNDNRRTIYTLSGGESFLISLALALGLSDLAGGQSMMQSLFIDEGFGTLDGKTLDQAMTTLEQLQAQGKTIGLISHVPQLRERIHCQIRLEPVGDGFSRLEVVDG